MCTLILAWDAFDDAPVVVGANRDEGLDRPSRPPARHTGDPVVVAPVDERAGGTWIGYNDRGLFAGIANRWSTADLAGERSRGLLVRDVLGTADADAATALVEAAVADADYAAFNLVVADATAAVLLEWDGRLRVRSLDAGVHVVTNVGADGELAMPAVRPERARTQARTARRVRTDLEPAADERADDWLDRAATVLADHELGVCVHGDSYGTRSSSLIAIGEAGISYEFADGPPCEVEYAAVKAQI